MAKKKQHIDDFFKDRLDGQPLPLDGSEWDRIAGELYDEKKRRGFFWWLLLIPAVLLGLWIGGVFNGDQDRKSPKEDISEAINPSIDSNTTRHSGIDSLSNSSNTAEFSDSKDAEIITAEIETENSPLTNNSNSIEDDNENGTITDSNEDNQTADNEAPSARSNNDILPIETPDAHRFIAIRGMRAIDEIPFAHPAPAVDLSALELTRLSYIKRIENKSPQIPLQIGLNIGAAINDQQLSAEQDSLVEYRNLNEKAALSQRIEVNLRTTYKGFQFKGGLSYFSKKQSLGNAFSNSPELRIQLYDTIPFVDLNGDTTWLPFNYRDSVVTKNLNNPNYHSIGVPILIAKSVPLGPKSRLGIGLQLQPQFIIQSGGSINAPSLRVREIDNSIVNSFNLSAGLQLSYGYRIHPSWEIELNTGINTDLLNMSNEQGIQQRFRMYGTEIGIYYRFR